MQDKDFFDTFSKVEPITKGWSEDKKYCVTKADGTKYLLRISPAERYETRKALFKILERVDALNIPMCRPVEFGTCVDGVYILESWIDGKDAEPALPMLPETEQYVLGLKSGEILRKIHSIPAPKTQEDWAIRFNRKTNNKIQKYRECELSFAGDDKIIDYIENNRHLLENRPQCFQHGDYHVGNMMLENGELRIIDFDRYDFGDPWEEFNRIVWSAAASPHFATGQLRGYFGGEPPLEFFKLLAFYIASNTLSSIYWAIPFGQGEIDTMMKQSQDVLAWYDNMQDPVPTWYLKDFYIQYIDGIPLKLKAPFDLDFIHRYGTVFKVFDDQDSGNLCFGVKSEDEKRYFIKFAGVPTARAIVSGEEAIANLKHTVPIYQDLAHPTLIKFVKAEKVGNGFAMVFEWADAICAQRMYPADYKAFQELSLETKQHIFSDIIEFHAHIAAKGYVAIDFYDGSIMWDAENERTIICDIDFYQKSPYVGRKDMWGSQRFVSPEERTDGAVIDEVTNVYTMGATAFCLFANSSRSPEAWPLSQELYKVVKKATSDIRSERQQALSQLFKEWSQQKYISNPCGSCSTAYWKEKYFAKPEGIRVIHGMDEARCYDVQKAKRYFRLIYRFDTDCNSVLPKGYSFHKTSLPDDCGQIAEFINRCYEGYALTEADILRWTKYPVFDTDLWVFIFDDASNTPVALGIADYDASIREGSLEWIQVLPENRGMGLGKAVVNELLTRMKEKADFVTVSGECDNPTNPEMLYRKCGFNGNDIWYVFREEAAK